MERIVAQGRGLASCISMEESSCGKLRKRVRQTSVLESILEPSIQTHWHSFQSCDSSCLIPNTLRVLHLSHLLLQQVRLHQHLEGPGPQLRQRHQELSQLQPQLPPHNPAKAKTEPELRNPRISDSLPASPRTPL